MQKPLERLNGKDAAKIVNGWAAQDPRIAKRLQTVYNQSNVSDAFITKLARKLTADSSEGAHEKVDSMDLMWAMVNIVGKIKGHYPIDGADTVADLSKRVLDLVV